jgi:hypothetical protein
MKSQIGIADKNDHLDDLDLDGRIVIKVVLNKRG